MKMSTNFTSTNRSPFRIQTVDSEPINYHEHFQGKISVDVIHDGTNIPPELLTNPSINHEKLLRSYQIERDWGADLVASRIASRLGIGQFMSVNTARCVIDFGRFPGSTKAGATHLGRYANNHPIAAWLSYEEKRSLLENHYDVISDGMDAFLKHKVLKLAIHTYDRYNQSGTERPAVSLVTRMEAYQNESRMPLGVFDPMFPDGLAEFTVDRVLRDRISLTLEKNSINVAHNYPYLLPAGSTEVRHQVWRFFSWLQDEYALAFPDSVEDPAHLWVWEMLLDTNLRSAWAGELRSIIHMYRQPEREKRALTEGCIQAYRNIRQFILANNSSMLNRYRHDPLRCMSLGIEVRKDLVWDFDEHGAPMQPNPKRGLEIADRIADAIITYLNIDRPAETI